MKRYTDLEQSKMLAKFLPDESAFQYHYEDGGSDIAEYGDMLRLYNGKYKR